VHVRVCPECGEEFRPEIARCSDCGAVLEDRHDEDSGEPLPPEGGPAMVPLPEGTYVPLLTVDRAADLDALAQRLGASGLPYRVRADGHSFTLLAREEDHERLSSVFDGLGQQEVESAPASSCPACGRALGGGESECPECGLALGDQEGVSLCPHCGRPLQLGSGCSFCGSGF
jgi:uncharacterized protein with PIN domain